jgi:hypothetical protein
MIWKNLGPVAITSRRRVVTSAVVYGLSLAVRFTSAAGEEIEVSAQAAQRAHAMLSIMINDGGQIPQKNWLTRVAQPLAFRDWPSATASPMPGSSTQPTCFPP